MTRDTPILVRAIAGALDWLALAIWPSRRLDPSREFPNL